MFGVHSWRYKVILGIIQRVGFDLISGYCNVFLFR